MIAEMEIRDALPKTIVCKLSEIILIEEEAREDALKTLKPIRQESLSYIRLQKFNDEIKTVFNNATNVSPLEYRDTAGKLGGAWLQRNWSPTINDLVTPKSDRIQSAPGRLFHRSLSAERLVRAASLRPREASIAGFGHLPTHP